MDKLYMELLENVLSAFPGKMVAVNNHKIHIYSEGNGSPSLVFLSGSGTASPLYDFKTLFTKLSDEYRIAVVEKSGYGYSEISGVFRDVDTILYETRTALKESGVEPPYILFPHSLSGMEALYWVQCYPAEIAAIIGIDPALPPFYEEMNVKSMVKKLSFASKLANGVLKSFCPIIANFLPPLKHKVLNEIDRQICKAITCHRILTKDMINEVSAIKNNARKINKETLKSVPMLFFITKGWEKMIRDYTRDLNVEIISYNLDHYLHNIIPDEIANRSKVFIKNEKRGV